MFCEGNCDRSFSLFQRLPCRRSGSREIVESGRAKWRVEGEKKKKGIGKEEKRGLFSPNPHPPLAVFSYSLFFAPSSQSERLEQAIVRLINAKQTKRKSKQRNSNNNKNRLLCRLANSEPGGSFSNLHDHCGENVAKKWMFVVSSVYLDSLNLSNVSDFSWSWILKDCI